MRNLFIALRPLVRDLAPTLIFILVWRTTGNLALAAGLGIAWGLAHLAWSLMTRKPVEALQWLSLLTTVSAGAATILTNSPAFILWKPTVIMAALGVVMLKPAWQAQYVPPVAQPHIPRSALVAWGRIWAGLMFALAAINAWLASQGLHDAWAWFNGIGSTAVQVALFAIQYLALRGVVRRSMQAAAAPAAS